MMVKGFFTKVPVVSSKAHSPGLHSSALDLPRFGHVDQDCHVVLRPEHSTDFSFEREVRVRDLRRCRQAATQFNSPAGEEVLRFLKC